MKFKKPVLKEDTAALDEEGDDLGDDLDGGADIADMANQDISEDEIEDFGGGAGQDKQYEEMLQNQIIQSTITREEWMLEVERVAHKLKINAAGGDGKEWRSHLDQTKKYADNMKSSLPDVRNKLERLSEDVSKALEKIAKKEGLLSKSFQGMTGDYRAHTEHLREIQNNFQTVSKNVGDMENELMDVNERLSTVQKKIDDTSVTFSDASPLAKIKKSITNVKNDIKAIDIRIGVVTNTLLQLKLKERARAQEEGKRLDILENEYEMEI